MKFALKIRSYFFLQGNSRLYKEGNGTPLQYSCLENPMDGGAWSAAVHGVAKSQIWLSAFPFTFHFHALGKEMATHSIVLAWRLPGMGDPGGLPSMGSHRVRHDWSNLAAAAGTMYFGFLVAQMVKNLPAMWETWVWSLGQEGALEKGMATNSVFLHGEFHGQEESGKLQSMGSQGVRHNWLTNTYNIFIQSSAVSMP